MNIIKTILAWLISIWFFPTFRRQMERYEAAIAAGRYIRGEDAWVYFGMDEAYILIWEEHQCPPSGYSSPVNTAASSVMLSYATAMTQ